MTTHVETGKHIVSESLVSEMRRVDESGNKNSSALCIVEGPCMEFGRVNQNNRIYSRKLIEDRIINYKPVQEAIKNKCMLGEGGHPETRIDISYPEVGLCVEKIWIPENSDHLVYGRFAILDTPVGRILDSLIRYGSKIGISARALAESKMEGNTEIMSETEYDLITFDAVPDPGFKCAHLEKVQESKSLASMTTSELKNNVAALNALKIPAFESRMHEMVEELTKRTDDDALSAVLRSKGMNKQTTGRKLESKRISVEEVMQSTTKSGKPAPDTKIQEELNSENVAYAKALADLDYYKSECERLHSELEIAVSAKDAVKVQNESLKHGIAKGIYQARYLENFSRRCPEVELSYHVVPANQLLPRLETGELDLTITGFYETPVVERMGLAWKTCVMVPNLAIMHRSHPLAGRETLRMEDLREQELIMLSPTENASYFEHIYRRCAQHGFQPRIQTLLPGFRSMMETLLRTHRGIILSNRFIFEADNPELRCLEIEGLHTGMILVWKERDCSAPLRQLIAAFPTEEDPPAL